VSIYAVSIFLSAFLLFLVQPMIGKYILPWFGSTPGLWTVCLLFFQVLLLLGYAYAHFIVSRLKPRGQALTHLAVLVFALLLLPITPSETLEPESGESPTLQILWVLLVTVGAPFLALSATGPLLQGWFARAHPGKSPYRLYALSNLGSLLALLCYPFIVERFVRLGQQTASWSVGFVVCAVSMAACAYSLWKVGAGPAPAKTAPEEIVPGGEAKPGFRSIALWVALAACGSGLLMATTNRLCLDVAVFPFLWVLPLSLYLVTFIVAFDHDRAYSRPLFVMLLPIAVFLAIYGVLRGTNTGMFAQIAIGAFALFICCMCCHGELVRRKPHPRHLTLFYLAVSGGGALGGLFVAVIAPVIFNGLFEYNLLIAATYVLILSLVARDLFQSGVLVSGRGALRIGTWATWAVFLGCVVLFTGLFLDRSAWPRRSLDDRSWAILQALLQNSRFVVTVLPVILLFGIGGWRFWRRDFLARWRSPQGLSILLLLASFAVSTVPVFGALTLDAVRNRSRVLARDRNFYGMLTIREFRVREPAHDRTLINGRIYHGMQFQLPERRDWPTTYYGPRSGVGLAIRFHPHREKANRQFRIGVVGLGTGTLAAYGNACVLAEYDENAPYVEARPRSPGDYLAFYEINPLVIEWADRHFTFLKDARARGAEISIFPGDARIVMERQIRTGHPERFDVLVIDAFSGDAIPVHLLTSECLKVYEAHMAEDGILAVHITNRHFELAPVARRLAMAAGFTAVPTRNPRDRAAGVDSSDWVLLTRNTDFLHDEGVRKATVEWPLTGPLWTDDFSSIFSVIK
jgi:hypothetical protein